jgi:hypothetical protein
MPDDAASCSLDGCHRTRSHYHRGDDEIVWTGAATTVVDTGTMFVDVPAYPAECGFRSLEHPILTCHYPPHPVNQRHSWQDASAGPTDPYGLDSDATDPLP